MKENLGSLGDQWYHCIRLPDGVTTPGIRGADAWDDQGLPDSVDGQTVLDVGAAEGYFSFEAERRGAKKVVAVDQWTDPKSLGTTASIIPTWSRHFHDVHVMLSSKVIPVDCSIYDFSWDHKFDTVIFSQVLYHLEHPVLGIEKIREYTAGKCYFESLITSGNEQLPHMVMNRDPMLIHDSSTIWIPSRTCLLAMLNMCSFSVEREVFNREVPEGRRLCLVLV